MAVVDGEEAELLWKKQRGGQVRQKKGGWVLARALCHPALICRRGQACMAPVRMRRRLHLVAISGFHHRAGARSTALAFCLFLASTAGGHGSMAASPGQALGKMAGRRSRSSLCNRRAQVELRSFACAITSPHLFPKRQARFLARSLRSQVTG
jgi:hypothetical protein